MHREIILGKSGHRNVAVSLEVLLRTRLLIQANSGGGKSYLLRRLAEQLFGKVQVIIIDPEGEFATLREKFAYVLVGEGGETPADVRSARLLAEKLLELRASAICDLFEPFRGRPNERRAWVASFLEALLDAPKKFWCPLVVIVDEAHKFCMEQMPKAADMREREIISRCKEAMIGVSSAGRKRGYCPVWATQRLAKVDKDASAELLNRLVGMTIEDLDIDRAAELLSVSRDERQEFKKAIKILDPGNFYALGRAISKDRLLIRIGTVETSHPELGEARFAAEPPPAPEKVKSLLPKLADLPRQAEEEARTLIQMKAEIRSLKSQLRMKVSPVKESVKEVVNQRAIERAVRQAETEFRKQIGARDSIIKRLGSGLLSIAQTAAGLSDIKLQAPKSPNLSESTRSGGVAELPTQSAPVVHSTQVPCSIEAEADSRLNTKLRAGAERMLAALATWYPNGMSEGQMRAHAGLKKSGTFSAYMSDLRRGQYIEEKNEMVFATQAGLDWCQHVPQAPQTTEEVVAVWEPKLRDGARRMLHVLVELQGESISKEELGEKAGLRKSGTFSAYLSDLRTARLAAVNQDGTVAANREALFF